MFKLVLLFGAFLLHSHMPLSSRYRRRMRNSHIIRSYICVIDMLIISGTVVSSSVSFIPELYHGASRVT